MISMIVWTFLVLVLVVVWLARGTRPVPVLVISLPRHHDRRRRFLRQTARLDFIDAVDGLDLAPCTGAGVTRGEKACFLSHIEAWRRVARADCDYALVFEDSANVRLPLAWSTLRRAVGLCGDDWDVAALGPRGCAAAVRPAGARTLLRLVDRFGMTCAGAPCTVDVWVRHQARMGRLRVCEAAVVGPFWDVVSETRRIL